MGGENEATRVDIEPGDVFQDSVFGGEYMVKYADDEVVLLMDKKDEYHHVYDREDFDIASKRTLVQPENRFKPKTTNADQ